MFKIIKLISRKNKKQPIENEEIKTEKLKQVKEDMTQLLKEIEDSVKKTDQEE